MGRDDLLPSAWSPEPLDRFLEPDEVAARLGVHPGTLGRWRLEHRGPPYLRFGSRAVRYSEQELVAWMKAQTPLALRRTRRTRLSAKVLDAVVEGLRRREEGGV